MGSWRMASAGALLIVAALGCQGEPQESNQTKEPDVLVSALVSGDVTDYEVFTGRVQTMHFQDIKARVTGYLKKIYFQEGEDVKRGDPLFDIDPAPYDALLAQAKAEVKQAQARLATMQDALTRDAASPDATSRANAMQDQYAVNEASAALEKSRASQTAAQNNVDYCHITADFSGRISRLNVDLNNDVIADNTVLASLVQLQPDMYAYFDVDERTMLDLLVDKSDRRKSGYLPQGKVSDEAADHLPLLLSLANDDDNPETFDHKGRLAIVDNKIDSATGTVRMWGVFQNDRKDLEPGLFVRVRMDKGAAHDSLLVSEAALGSDQGFRYLYVVNDNNEAEYVRVDVGQKTKGLVAVSASPNYDGKGKPKPGIVLTKDTRVVVDGLQRIHPVLDEKTGAPKPVKVNAQLTAMPSALE